MILDLSLIPLHSGSPPDALLPYGCTLVFQLHVQLTYSGSPSILNTPNLATRRGIPYANRHFDIMTSHIVSLAESEGCQNLSEKSSWA